MSTTTLPTSDTKLGFDPIYLQAFEDKLFIEGPQTARRLTNFFTLLLFATVIATHYLQFKQSLTHWLTKTPLQKCSSG